MDKEIKTKNISISYRHFSTLRDSRGRFIVNMRVDSKQETQ